MLGKLECRLTPPSAMLGNLSAMLGGLQEGDRSKHLPQKQRLAARVDLSSWSRLLEQYTGRTAIFNLAKVDDFSFRSPAASNAWLRYPSETARAKLSMSMIETFFNFS